jgi:hypothetical protein
MSLETLPKPILQIPEKIGGGVKLKNNAVQFLILKKVKTQKIACLNVQNTYGTTTSKPELSHNEDGTVKFDFQDDVSNKD